MLERPDLVTDPEFAHRKNRSANKDKLRAIIAGVFAGDKLENWMAKMKKANIPVGYLRTVEEGFNAPEVRDRHRLSQIPHPTAGAVPNIETPLNMSLTPTIDPMAARYSASIPKKCCARRSVTMTVASRRWPRRVHSEKPGIPADPRVNRKRSPGHSSVGGIAKTCQRGARYAPQKK